MEEDHHHLLHPLIPTRSRSRTTTIKIPFVDNSTNEHNKVKIISSKYSNILFRLVSIVFIGLVSIWANYEAAKGFEITITSEDAVDSVASQRFKLFYISNDQATRIVLNTSKFVENLLYPNNSYPKKQVNRVIVRLASRNLIHMVNVESNTRHEFVIHLSPSIMEEINFKHVMLSAIQQGMTRVWIYNNGPTSLIEGMVEYIISSVGLGDVSDSGDVECDGIWWKDRDPKGVAQFLNYCEGNKKGFMIRRLNQAMRDGNWEDPTVDDALVARHASSASTC